MPVARQRFTLKDAKREAAADFFADVLFKGKEYRGEIATALKYGNELPEGSYEASLSALEEIAHKDKNLFHRIIEAVKRFISYIKGNKTTRKLETDLARLERKLQDVYESAETKRPTEDIGEQFSIIVPYTEKQKSNFNNSSKIIIYSSETQLNNFINNALNKKNLSQKMYFGLPTEELVDLINSKVGVDVSGCNVSLRADTILKIAKDHGNDDVESLRGQRAITKNDFLNIPKMLNTINDVEYGGIYNDPSGKEVPFFNLKNSFDVTVTIGAYKQDKHLDLRLHTMYAKKRSNSTAVDAKAPTFKTPEANRENASIDIISNQSVKSQEKISVMDTEYLNLAKNPEKNEAKLRKMVDEAAKESGYSERLYHQTENNFTIFDTRHSGAGSRDNETPFGIFMKKTDADIGLKGKKQIGLFAKIEKPLKAYSRDSLVNSLERLSPEYKVIKEQLANLDKEYQEKVDNAHKEWQEWVAEWRNKNPNAKRVDAYNDPEFESVFSKEGEIVDEWSEKAATLDKKAKEIITSTLKSNGYDGIILLNDIGSFGRRTDAYIALESSQVKSADLVTYDDEGNIIPLSERFSSDNPDIRFSLRGDRLEELRYNPTMFAKRLIKKFNIKNVEVEELAGKLRKLVVKHNKGGNDWDYNSEGEIL